jgi:hypothetical protein
VDDVFLFILYGHHGCKIDNMSMLYNYCNVVLLSSVVLANLCYMKAGVNIRDQKVTMFWGYLEHFFLLHALKQNKLIHGGLAS